LLTCARLMHALAIRTGRERQFLMYIHGLSLPIPLLLSTSFGLCLYQVDRHRQTKPLLYEVSILNPEETLEGTNVVVRAG
jgi:uncharacterized membrane protein